MKNILFVHGWIEILNLRWFDELEISTWVNQTTLHKMSLSTMHHLRISGKLQLILQRKKIESEENWHIVQIVLLHLHDYFFVHFSILLTYVPQKNLSFFLNSSWWIFLHCSNNEITYSLFPKYSFLIWKFFINYSYYFILFHFNESF